MRALLRAEFIKLASKDAARPGGGRHRRCRPGRRLHDRERQDRGPHSGGARPALLHAGLGQPGHVLGIRTFTDEFRHGSIVPTLVVTPDRRKVVVAKMATSAAAGAALAAIAQVVMVTLGLLLIGARGVEATFEARDLAAVGGAVLAGGLWAAIGAGVGAIVRHQVAGVVGALVWVLLLENLGGGLLGLAARFLPGQAAHGLAQASQAGTILPPVAAAGLLVAYAMLAAAAAMLRMARTDVAAT